MKEFGIVARGPFKGMKYFTIRSDGSHNYSKVLGTYETELYPFIYDAISNNPNTIINIGAGDGYYSIGFSLLFPDAKIIAYENTNHEQIMHKDTSILNNITNCELRGLCTQDQLLEMDIDNKTLIICDCEGYELQIFTDDLFNKFSNFNAIIETHDFINPYITETLAKLFKKNGYIVYIIESIKDREKINLYNLNELKELNPDDKFNLLKERPDGMKWLYCKKII